MADSSATPSLASKAGAQTYLQTLHPSIRDEVVSLAQKRLLKSQAGQSPSVLEVAVPFSTATLTPAQQITRKQPVADTELPSEQKIGDLPSLPAVAIPPLNVSLVPQKPSIAEESKAQPIDSTAQSVEQDNGADERPGEGKEAKGKAAGRY
jgi:hypothetical protein